MKSVGFFLAGVATGWVMRASFDSLRGLAVSAVATGYEMVERTKRLIAEEKEYFEDLVAEGRSKFEANRARAEARRAARAPVSVARH